MESANSILASPLLPALILWAGAVILTFLPPTRFRSGQLRGLVILTMIVSLFSLFALYARPTVAQYSWQWRPEYLMLWIHLPWNWAVSVLAALLGLTGVLLSGRLQTGPLEVESRFLYGRFLAINLATTAITLMLVNTANILSMVFMWVAFDVIMVARQNLVTHQYGALQHDYTLTYHRSLGLNMLGALVLLVGLFPAGEFVPRQMLTGSMLPAVSTYALLLAGALRAGAYPLHLWLLPNSLLRLSPAERIFSQVLPALTGLWLLGFSLNLAQRHQEIIPSILPWAALMFLFASIASLQFRGPFLRANYVTVTAVTLAGLMGLKGAQEGTANLLLPTAAMLPAAALWVLADRLPRAGQRFAFQGLGAAALLGWPLTPAGAMLGQWLEGFRADSFLLEACLWLGSVVFSASLWLPLLRGRESAGGPVGSGTYLMWTGTLLLALPLVVIGVFPSLLFNLARMDMPSSMLWLYPGHLPISLAYVLVSGGGGLGLAYLLAHRPSPWRRLAFIAAHWASLDWVGGGIQLGMPRLSIVWSRLLNVVEGPGLLGWSLAFSLMLWTVLS